MNYPPGHQELMGKEIASLDVSRMWQYGTVLQDLIGMEWMYFHTDLYPPTLDIPVIRMHDHSPYEK